MSRALRPAAVELDAVAVLHGSSPEKMAYAGARRRVAVEYKVRLIN
jgi:hypothetical protein